MLSGSSGDLKPWIEENGPIRVVVLPSRHIAKSDAVQRLVHELVSDLVGERGFEPPAPASRRQCSTRLSYSPTDRLRRALVRAAGGAPSSSPHAHLPPSADIISAMLANFSRGAPGRARAVSAVLFFCLLCKVLMSTL